MRLKVGLPSVIIFFPYNYKSETLCTINLLSLINFYCGTRGNTWNFKLLGSWDQLAIYGLQIVENQRRGGSLVTTHSKDLCVTFVEGKCSDPSCRVFMNVLDHLLPDNIASASMLSDHRFLVVRCSVRDLRCDSLICTTAHINSINFINSFYCRCSHCHCVPRRVYRITLMSKVSRQRISLAIRGEHSADN